MKTTNIKFCNAIEKMNPGDCFSPYSSKYSEFIMNKNGSFRGSGDENPMELPLTKHQLLLLGDIIHAEPDNSHVNIGIMSDKNKKWNCYECPVRCSFITCYNPNDSVDCDHGDKWFEEKPTEEISSPKKYKLVIPEELIEIVKTSLKEMNGEIKSDWSDKIPKKWLVEIKDEPMTVDVYIELIDDNIKSHGTKCLNMDEMLRARKDFKAGAKKEALKYKPLVGLVKYYIDKKYDTTWTNEFKEALEELEKLNQNESGNLA